MRPSTWEKQPWMKRRLAFDISTAMITGDTIDSFEAKIYDSAGNDLSATMLAGSSKDDTVAYVWVQGGTSGSSYFLRLRITTTLGELIEDDLNIIVRQRGY
jgi:hypothetical protein